MLVGKLTQVKESKNTCRKTNLFAGKQKYLKHSKNTWREAKTFSQESKDKKYEKATKNSKGNMTLQGHRTTALL